MQGMIPTSGPGSGPEQPSAQTIFSSPRERRLWLWTAVVIAAIFTALFLGRPLAGLLREQGLLGAAFALALLLVGSAVLTLAVRARVSGLEIGIGLGVAAVFLLLWVRISLPEERTHLIEYGVLGALIAAALQERAANGRSMPSPGLLAAAGTALVGGVDEGLQYFLPERVFDPRDLLFNLLAGLTAVVAGVALGRIRRPIR